MSSFTLSLLIPAQTGVSGERVSLKMHVCNWALAYKIKNPDYNSRVDQINYLYNFTEFVSAIAPIAIIRPIGAHEVEPGVSLI